MDGKDGTVTETGRCLVTFTVVVSWTKEIRSGSLSELGYSNRKWEEEPELS